MVNQPETLGCQPKARAFPGRKFGQDYPQPVLPNVLPLPAKNSTKQEGSRANNVGYVIEIQGTA
jgi:hypothetical protein